MAVNNSLTKTEQNKKPGFSAVINQPDYQKAILNTLQDKNVAKRFTASIVSAVTATPDLRKCEPMSIISAGLLGEALGLSPSPQLGHYYFVPFKNNGTDVAQFILGYKGYIQLATRSGQYKKLTVLPIKQGELISFNPLEEEIQVDLIQNENQRENTPTAGYYAMFEYTNGFKKAIYWSIEKMRSHALKYSAGYRSDTKKGTAYTFWSKDFDGMACKTMLRQLISKWGLMSIEMQRAYEADNGVIGVNGEVMLSDEPIHEESAENDSSIVEVTPEESDNTPIQESFADIMEG